MPNVKTIFTDALAFVEKAAPTLESTLVNDAKSALAAAEAAFAPVLDASVSTAVGLITAKYPLNAPFSQEEISFLQGVIAKLQGMLPA